MAIKNVGVFLAYPLFTDLKKEGLGRYLAMILKGFQEKDVSIHIACPNWMIKNLEELFDVEGLDFDKINFLNTKNDSYALRVFNKISVKPKKERTFIIQKLLKSFSGYVTDLKIKLLKDVVVARTPFDIASFLAKVLPLIVILAFGAPLFILWQLALKLKIFSFNILRKLTRYEKLSNRIRPYFYIDQRNVLAQLGYQAIHENEIDKLIEVCNKNKLIEAWYCPTAFWPSFNEIKRPRLVCVPDVVLRDCPVGFATITDDSILESLRLVEQTINSSNNFVVYSDSVKFNTLVKKYSINAEQITSVEHAPQNLMPLIAVNDPIDPESATKRMCQCLLMTALNRANSKGYANGFQNSNLKYLFYPSQFRPNKNVLTLLKAYKYLLRSKLVQHKLVLTGNPDDSNPQIKEFIEKNNLHRDVLFLHNLSIKELAACYYLADLSISPTLSEGGFPFTFSESLSLGTPILMSRIDINLDTITDPDLREKMLFNHLDYKEMGDMIFCSLNKLKHLLDLQSKFYVEMQSRTWSDVAEEHLNILSRIANEN